MSGLYVRARDVGRFWIAAPLFPPRPEWSASVPYAEYCRAEDSWSLLCASWAGLRDLVLAECTRRPSMAEFVFRRFLDIPSFVDEEEEAAWRDAQKYVRNALLRNAKQVRAHARELEQRRILSEARRALKRCTCQHCPVHKGWAAATKRRLKKAALER